MRRLRMSATRVDISGTKIADSVVSPEGKVLNKVRFPTQAITPNQLVETIADAATEVKDGFPVGGGCTWVQFAWSAGAIGGWCRSSWASTI
jgi:predicted NBD/HSP70 family sugar kinase